MRVTLDIDIDELVEEIGGARLLEYIDEDDIYDKAEDIGWADAEDNYKKYKQSNLLNQEKLDLFLSYIDDVSLEEVQNLVGSRFKKNN